MKWKEVITLNEQAIEKFKDNPALKDKVERMREDNNRMKLLSPTSLNSHLDKKSEKKIVKCFKDLGIEYKPDPIDNRDALLREMNRIANRMMRG